MPEIGTSGSMSGDGKRSVGHRPQATAPILDSTDSFVTTIHRARKVSGNKLPSLGTARDGRIWPRLCENSAWNNRTQNFEAYGHAQSKKRKNSPFARRYEQVRFRF